MKKKITLTVLTLLIAGFTLHAQSNYVKKVIIANEGRYDYINSVQTVPVTIGSYDPSTHIYTAFDTIQDVRFATHVIVDGSSIYVAADSQIVRYDADTYERLAITNVRGVRKLAVWNNTLLISRGEYGVTFDSYFQVYDKNNLGFLYDLPVASGPQFATECIIVKDDIAYVAVGNGFDWGNEVGLIGKVNLTTQSYMNEINLGVGGTNPEGMFMENDNIYTVNNTNYYASSISTVNITSQNAITTSLANTTTGCGASGLAAGLVMFQPSSDKQLGRFNPSTLTVQDTLHINRNIYGMVADTLNNLIYFGETDYVNYGRITIYDLSGALIDSFDVGVAPGNIALDIRSTVGVKEPAQTHSLNCYPNPAHDQVLVVRDNSSNPDDTFIVTDIAGRELNRIYTSLSRFTLDIHTFESGIYILTSVTNPSEKVKIVKQ